MKLLYYDDVTVSAFCSSNLLKLAAAIVDDLIIFVCTEDDLTFSCSIQLCWLKLTFFYYAASLRITSLLFSRAVLTMRP